MKKIYFLVMVLFAVSGAWGQATLPVIFDLSGGMSYNFTTLSGTTLPTNLSVGTVSSTSTGTFLTDLSTDAANGSGANQWNAEGANGISFLGSSNNRRGCFQFRANSTNRTNVVVSWSCNTVLNQTNNNFIELQWKDGSSGSWNAVTGVTTSGTYPYQGNAATTSYSVTLPVAANGLSDLRIRWIYYEDATGGARDRLALDNITVSSSSGAPVPTITVNSSMTSFASIAGTPSSEQFYTVSGSNLTNDISIAPPVGFELSTTSGSGFVANPSSLTLTQSTGTVANTTIYVRSNAAIAGSYGGNITHISSGASQQNIAVSSTVGLMAPAVNAPTVFTANSFAANWGAVTGASGYFLDVATSNTFSTGVTTTLVKWDFPNASDDNIADGGISANTTNTIVTNVAGTFSYTPIMSSTTSAASVDVDWVNGSNSKYWEINFSTIGYNTINFSSVQRSSNSGPKSFKVQYKVGAGGTYADVTGAAVTVGNDWTTGVLTSISLPAGCENKSSVYLRWIMTSNTSVNAGTVATTGTSAIDNVIVNGTSSTTLLTGYNDLSVIGTSQIVTVPGPGTYYFRVRATDGTVTSANSNVISVVINDQATAAFRSTTTGNYSDGSTWEFNASPPAYYAAASQSPTSNNAVTVNNGHTVSLTANGAAGMLTLQPTGNIILATNNLVVNSVIGGNASGYISTNSTGILTIKNISSTATTFPVGNGSSYTPVTISNTGTADGFSVNVAAGTPCNTKPSESVNRIWTITEGTVGGSNANISLQWNTGDENSAFTRSLCTAVHCAGGVVDSKGANNSAGGTDPFTQTITGISSFSPFGVTSDNLILPLGINYFRGSRQASAHNLIWKVGCAPSSKVTMTVERSNNGRSWKDINSITADAARCQDAFNYSDMTPLVGINYYRLRSVDIDGKISYSDIVTLLNATKGLQLVSVAPNPTVNGLVKLNVTSAQPAKMEILITDMMGRVVARTTETILNGFNAIPMDVSRLAAGVYQLHGNTLEGKTTTLSFVKQ